MTIEELALLTFDKRKMVIATANELFKAYGEEDAVRLLQEVSKQSRNIPISTRYDNAVKILGL